MSRRRFVLRYRGDGPLPDTDMERLRHLPDITVVDVSPRMVLVESAEEFFDVLVEAFPEWLVAPEQTIALPDTRQRISRPQE